MAEKEQYADPETLLGRPFQEGSVTEILYPNQNTRLAGTFVYFGSESSYYGRNVKLVTRDRARKEIKIIFDQGEELACATYRFDKTRIRFLEAPIKRPRRS